MSNEMENLPQKPTQTSTHIPSKCSVAIEPASVILDIQNREEPGIPIDLSRQELLNAIDFEISQREDINSKHGINVWGIIGVVVALLWASLNELTQHSHNWTNTILAFFVAWWFLMQVASVFTTGLGWSGTIKPEAGKPTTVTQLILFTGINPDTVPYYICEVSFLFGVSLHLGINGFYLLSLAACVFYAFMFFLLILVFVVLKVQIPIELSATTQLRNFQQWIVLACVWLFVLAVLFLGLKTIAEAWPTIKNEDIRMGCELAALGAVISLSIKHTRAPMGLAEFRSLRACA